MTELGHHVHEHAHLFETAAALLSGTASRHALTGAAADFLRAVWGSPLDAGAAENRSALLRLAARCDDCFALGLPNAPSAFAYGTIADPRRFGVEGRKAGSGGVGLSFARAFEGALGETAEYLSFLEWPDDPLIQSAPAVSYGDWARSIVKAPSADWVATTDWNGQGAAPLPAELVLRRPGAAYQADSVGVAAGRTWEAASLTGFFEAVERDAVQLWWRGGAPGRRVAMPRAAASCERIRDPARQVWFLDITSDLGVPVIVCLSATQAGTEVVAGAAAALDAEHAAQSALLEMCQMELARAMSLNRPAESQSAAALDDLWHRRDRELTLTAAPRLNGDEAGPTRCRTAQTMREALQKVHDCGLSPRLIDLSRADLAIFVARVVLVGAQPTSPEVVTPRLDAVITKNAFRLDRSRAAVSPI